MLIILVVFIINMVFSAAMIYGAMRIFRIDGEPVAIVMVCGASMLVSFLPGIMGCLASFVTMIYLLNRWTDIDNWFQGNAGRSGCCRWVSSAPGCGLGHRPGIRPV